MIKRKQNIDGIKFEILKIKKANPLIRLFSINHWYIELKYKNRIIKKRFWASTPDPTTEKLLWDIKHFLKSVEIILEPETEK